MERGKEERGGEGERTPSHEEPGDIRVEVEDKRRRWRLRRKRKRRKGGIEVGNSEANDSNFDNKEHGATSLVWGRSLRGRREGRKE